MRKTRNFYDVPFQIEEGLFYNSRTSKYFSMLKLNFYLFIFLNLFQHKLDLAEIEDLLDLYLKLGNS